MAYIAPNSTVEFYSNIGLNDNYDDTLYFASTASKDSYFNSVTKLATATAMSYNREQRGFIRVELPMSTLISASYMRFKNTSYENKWFYAFVKNVEYINNNCTQVNFQIDPLITWMGTFTLNQCFIERQHTLGDAIGANIADEGLGLGNYVCEDTDSYDLGDIGLMVYKTYNPDEDSVPAEGLAQGTYIPLSTYFYFLNDPNISLLETFLNTLTTDNRIDEVVSIKLLPARFVSDTEVVPHFGKSITKPYSSIGGGATPYIPKNNKLYVYPYKYLQVDNCEGQSTVYKYEYFNSLPDAESYGPCDFSIMGSGDTPEVSLMCTPIRYNGIAQNFEESINMNNFPSVAWNVDAYKAYLAQRDSTIYGEIIATAVTSGASGALSGAVHGGAGTAVVGGLMGINSGVMGGAKTLLSDAINEKLKDTLPSRMPNQTRGRSESNLMLQSDNKKFYFRKMSITKNYAMMIDNYFTMFGYKIGQVGVPNMNARPNWTYVKTIGCSVDGAIPADDASAIEDIFNKGVRFWKNHNNIGNYSLNNAPA